MVSQVAKGYSIANKQISRSGEFVVAQINGVERITLALMKVDRHTPPKSVCSNSSNIRHRKSYSIM